MMRSMFSGVSGLRVHQTRMDVIGNNIANVNTIGYKSQRVTFNEVFSQTLQSASAASDETGRGGLNPMQVGLGVNISSIDMLMTQGAAQRTDNPFDLMINGEGFIVVGDATGKYFTRAGALRMDDEGNLIIPNGMKVQGWPASKDGKEITRKDVEPLKLNDPTTKFTSPEATTATSLSGNLNTDDGTDGKGVPSQLKMYDSLGNLYSINVFLKYDAGKWSVTDQNGETGKPIILTDQNGNTYQAAQATEIFPNNIELEFDASGKLTTTAAFTLPTIDMSKALLLDDTGATTATTGPIANISQITIDYSGLTQYASKTNVNTKVGDKDGKNAGKAAGTMSGYDVGTDGKITAYYSNGDRRLLGQIVVAQFDNPAGLEKNGDNLYTATANSGDFDNVGKVGNFQAGVLEMSNVDLSSEFTDMIVTQRGFQANSRIISVSDEMLQELTNLKR
ncbi:flagellar biosynthesis protein FlgE [Sporanaerobium hydrogeniformans]|uniref:Flagellar biosynthesis protein FlgE n=1 Tax=Sporanaerobium hydrogeniformans TaxID=3072179 RepID=A0AC61DEW4_9FIRM|nr:flagellar hook protein FlgE [Sporanaerobium hydrogeniformans]PHV71746.1 flagellar biosynthesis protein FlgE [Sporanaerobium hydrogeniformans]